jgi:hypothetical protein
MTLWVFVLIASEFMPVSLLTIALARPRIGYQSGRSCAG